LQFDNTDRLQWFRRQAIAVRTRDRKMPRPFTPAGALSWQYSVSADVHETQAAPGLDVLVAIAADVEGRAAEDVAVTMMAVTMMSAMALTVMSAVAVTAMTMTTTTRRSRGHGGGTEGDRGDDGE
jgi:hypothetical protein